MAERSIKGVLSRSSWDFYEYSTGWAYVEANWTAAGNLIFLSNPGTQQSNLDIYRVEFSASSPLSIEWSAYSNTPNPVANTATESIINACETNQPMPLGSCGAVATAWTGAYVPIRSRLDPTQFDNLMLGMAGPFITLAPGWSIVVSQRAAGTATVAATFWFQTILDMISQAR